MRKVEIISASAGSGKTTRIARVLRESIQSNEARPEAVLATTFTRKAAAELKERVRSELFRAGLQDAALELEGARIGTVNSVCGRIVSDFALELGLSPQLRVLDEDQAEVGVRKAISRVVTETEKAVLEGVQHRMDAFDWRGAVNTVIAHARANGLDAEALKRSGQRSIEALVAHLPPPSKSSGAVLDKRLREEIEAGLGAIDLVEDTTDKTAKFVNACQEILGELRRGPAKWKSWPKLSSKSNEPGAKSKKALERIRELAQQVDEHPRLRDDLVAAVELVFGIAARTMDVWEREKRERGVIDFVDQEVKALALLEDPRFAERLAGELDLVLVDEFQDTSPLQLQLFMKLASLAKRSVWVGDQKQSIFGFRGTDPGLMDAAMESLLGGKSPEILGESFRSRPSLVSLTSELFAKAFAPHGIPEERVKLTPGKPTEPPGLGAPVEWWALEGKKREDHLSALADGVRKLLVDPTARVRDRRSNEARKLTAGDVAVLCRTNRDCEMLAAALACHGVSATVQRGGLLSTPEGRVAVLGLRLFVDARDRLAAAELALLLEHPHEPFRWLDLALENVGEVPFADASFHAALEAARARFPLAGPLAALDAVFDALQLRELLPRWGQQDQRFANLDALRAHAETWVSQVLSEGGAATAAGLIAHLDALDEVRADSQAHLPGVDAVQVATWHASKGLEWPVTVLALNDNERDVPMFGLSVQSDAQRFDVDAPLEGRWLRYWPNPFHSSQTTGLRRSVESGTEATEARARAEKQELRLLYVGWTRARDRLVLAAKTGVTWPLSLLSEVKPPKESGPVTWGGVTVELQLREGACALPEPEPLEADALPTASGPKEHPRAWRSPSTLEARGEATFVRLGDELREGLSTDDMNALGQAVHGFLAADRPSFSAAEREGLATQCLASWKQAEALAPRRLLDASDRLHEWVAMNWPTAKWHRELAVSHQLPAGTMLRGTADLVLELDDGFVLVDHKSFPGSEERALEKAAGFHGQLDAYAKALEAAWKKPHLGSFIHLPLLGRIAQVRAA